jgi:hypothetical protein
MSTEDDDNVGAALVIISALALLVASWPWRAYCAAWVWGMLAVPEGLPEVSWPAWLALGLGLLAMRARGVSASDIQATNDAKPTTQAAWLLGDAVVAWTAPLVVVCIAYAVRWVLL